jgi:exopolysaccharide biosynthesis protein
LYGTALELFRSFQISHGAEAKSMKNTDRTNTSKGNTISLKEPQKIFTESEYRDENIYLTVKKSLNPNLVYYIADIKLESAQYFRTAFAKDKFGCNLYESTSGQAIRHNAVLAINGTNYGARDTGLVIHDGKLYRDNSKRPSLVLLQNGDMCIAGIGPSGYQLIEEGAWQSWSFGPTLVRDSNNVIGQSKTDRPDPRCGIGMIAPNHYIFICVDGRQAKSKGMKLIDFAKLFLAYNCSIAYNLDGGGSATMVMNREIVNSPCNKKERKISDIVYIGLN